MVFHLQGDSTGIKAVHWRFISGSTWGYRYHPDELSACLQSSYQLVLLLAKQIHKFVDNRHLIPLKGSDARQLLPCFFFKTNKQTNKQTDKQSRRKLDCKWTRNCQVSPKELDTERKAYYPSSPVEAQCHDRSSRDVITRDGLDLVRMLLPVHLGSLKRQIFRQAFVTRYWWLTKRKALVGSDPSGHVVGARMSAQPFLLFGVASKTCLPLLKVKWADVGNWHMQGTPLATNINSSENWWVNTCTGGKELGRIVVGICTRFTVARVVLDSDGPRHWGGEQGRIWGGGTFRP